jgi:hypothetical protein
VTQEKDNKNNGPWTRGLPQEEQKPSTNPESRIQNPEEIEEHAHGVVVNGIAIKGPNFTLDFKAIDMAAALIPMDAGRARQIAEICALDWAANGNKPSNPMAQVKAAMRSDYNQGQIADLRAARAQRPPSGRMSKADLEKIVDDAMSGGKNTGRTFQ